MPATRRQAYTEQTRRALLDSARACFGERGFHDSSVAQIAAGAGLSPGAVYKHFRSKEELFYEVAETLQRESYEEIGKRMAPLADPRDRLREARAAYLEAFERPEVQRILCVDYSAVLGDVRWRRERPAYTVVVLKDLLGALAAEGRLRLEAVDGAAHMIFGALNEGLLWMAASNRPRKARAEMEAFLEALEEALIGDPASRGR